MKRISYSGYRFPPEIIQQAIWLYLRFTLSLRDVEDLLAERGITVSYESIRRWINHFGPMIAADLRRRRPKPHTSWHLDEVYLKIDGRMVYLWRAVDAEGEILDVLVQSKRDKYAAVKLMRKLVPFRLDQHIEDLAFGVDGAPQVDHAAIDLEIDLIQMPARVGFRSASTQVRGDRRPEVVYPAPNGLVGDCNAAFCQQIFDVAQAQGEAEVEPDRLLNDRGRETVAAIADSLHPVGYRAARGAATFQAM